MDEYVTIKNRYQLIEPIGRGAMGPVYRGVDTSNGQQVAIKIVRSDKVEGGPMLAFFEQEGQALQQLNHPNIVHFSDLFAEDGTYYLVMAYVAGGSLSEHLQHGPLSLARVFEISLDLADALTRAHRLGIIHRDVKPQNILLAADGTPRLSDFGLAYLTENQPDFPASDLVGTLHYMPPESFQGYPADERTDIWALGVVLFEMLTGRLPFDAQNTNALIHKIQTEPVPDIRSGHPEFPEALGDLLDLMLAKKPEDRIASVRLVGAALEAIKNGHEALLPTLLDQRIARVGASNLPEPPTTFIGREHALAEIVAIFTESGGQLLTLTGPGGVGKTRMALQAAHAMHHYYADGIFFVDLAPVSAPELVPGRIARTLGIKEAGSRAVENELQAFFQQKQHLLVLDNFEQVIEAAPIVSSLLSGAPELAVLVTSREALYVSGERVYPVPPMSLPELSRDASPMALSAAESVNLFVQRAAAAQPGFRLTAANARDIAEICIHLDGLPLAIELAAARTRILPPRYLRRDIGDILNTLAAGSRDRAPRQQTLRAAIDWSYELLNDQEQLLFNRLSIFQGGGTLEAIEAVCLPGLSIGMISGLESLVGKSLLLRGGDLETEPRFIYLKTIHQYARQRLDESQEVAVVEKRHADYYLNLVERVVPQLIGPDQEMSLRVLRTEYDNLREVLTWSLTGEHPLLGLQMIAALADFWYYEESAVEGKHWVDEGLSRLETAPPDLQVRLLNGAGTLAFNRGDHQQGAKWNQQALDLARELNNRSGAAWALFWLSAHATGSPATYEQGITLCEQALVLFKEVEDPYGLAWGNNQIGELSRLLGKYEQAQEAYLRSIAICRDAGNIRREAIALINLGYVAQHQEHYAQAEMNILEGLSLLYHLKLVHHCAIALATLSGPLVAQGGAKRATILLGASDAAFARLAIPQQPADKMEIDRYVSAVREQLNDAEFQEAWSKGQAMPFDEAVAFAFLKTTPYPQS